MAYIQGFVVAVPTANKEAYRDHATKALPLFREFGAGRVVEGWGDDVPDGKVTDFRGAVQAKDDEAVVFSWIEFADKATADAAGEQMMSDPRMAEFGEMPFDGSRMIYAGFTPLVDTGPGGAMGYIDGFVIAVAADKKDAFAVFAQATAHAFIDHGATRVVEAWCDAVTPGKVTDFNRAVNAAQGESIVFAWIEWPSKAARDAGQAGVEADPRVKAGPADAPFDRQRMIYGGFAPIVDA